MSTKKNTIVLSETIDAPKAAIFPMLIQQDKLSRWFPTHAESDPVVGGSYLFSFEFMDPARAKGNHLRRGTFSEITPNERVRYSWDVGNTDVDFSLRDVNGKTEITIEHSGWNDGDTNEIEGHTKGWSFFLANLKSVMESNTDNRSPVMGMTAKEYAAKA